MAAPYKQAKGTDFPEGIFTVETDTVADIPDQSQVFAIKTERYIDFPAEPQVCTLERERLEFADDEWGICSVETKPLDLSNKPRVRPVAPETLADYRGEPQVWFFKGGVQLHDEPCVCTARTQGVHCPDSPRMSEEQKTTEIFTHMFAVDESHGKESFVSTPPSAQTGGVYTNGYGPGAQDNSRLSPPAGAEDVNSANYSGIAAPYGSGYVKSELVQGHTVAKSYVAGPETKIPNGGGLRGVTVESLGYQCRKYQPVVSLERLSGLEGGLHTEDIKPVVVDNVPVSGSRVEAPGSQVTETGASAVVLYMDSADISQSRGVKRPLDAPAGKTDRGEKRKTTKRRRRRKFLTYRKNVRKTSSVKKPLNDNNARRKIYTCKICEKTFHRAYELKSHKKVHAPAKPDPHVCDYCPEYFSTIRKLRAHTKVHRSGQAGRHVCDKCWGTFPDATALSSHLKAHVLLNPFRCDVCKKGFFKSSALALHQVSHSTDRPFTCGVCHQVFSPLSALKEHSLSHVSFTPPRAKNVVKKPSSCTCPECHRAFRGLSALMQHRRVHTKEPFKCEYCGKVLRTCRSLIKHESAHSLACKFCGQESESLAALKRHEGIHSGEKLHPCQFCDSTFVYSSSLVRHQEIHTGTPSEPLESCKLCGETFTTATALRLHERTHGGCEGPLHRCRLCERAFGCAASLESHLRSHEGEKAYRCPVCDQRFFYSASLKLHVLVHSLTSDLQASRGGVSRHTQTEPEASASSSEDEA